MVRRLRKLMWWARGGNVSHWDSSWHILSKVVDRSWGQPEGSLFNSYYIMVLGRALLLFMDYSTLPLICNLYWWVLSKEVSSSIFKVFGTMRTGIEPKSSGPLANTLPTRPIRTAYPKMLPFHLSINMIFLLSHLWFWTSVWSFYFIH